MDLSEENENASEIKRIVEECFDTLQANGDQTELLNILFLYQQLKVPSLNI